MRRHRCVARRGEGDRGAVIVEAALVLPLLLALLLGFVEFSLVEFQQSQASSAARDGARVGILGYRQADVVGSADHDAIVAAVNARLAGQEDVSVAVRCLSDAGAATACGSVALSGSIEVTVSWPHDDLTFFGPLVPSTIESSSTMALVGGPVTVSPTTSTTASSSTTSTTTPSTTTPPPPSQCQVVVPPSPLVAGAEVKSNGRLDGDLVISRVTTNGDSSCGTPRVRIYYAGGGASGPITGPKVMSSVAGQPNTWTVTWSKNESPAGSWATGTITFEVLDTSLTVLGQFTFEMTS